MSDSTSLTRLVPVTPDLDEPGPLRQNPMMSLSGTALIVDTDQEFARRLAAVVEELGLQPEIVRSGDAAATKLVNKAYDVVITELSLPGLDGFGLIKALRARYDRSQTRVVVVSAFVEQRTMASNNKEALGIDAVIARNGPIDAALRTLRRCLTAGAEKIDPMATQRVSLSTRGTPMPHRHPLDPAFETRRVSLSSQGTPLPGALPPTHPGREIDLDNEDAELELEALEPVTRETREHQRLQAVNEAGVDETEPPDPELQELIASVAKEFGVDTALVGFMLADRQWFKAYSGIDGQLLADRGVARELTFCKHIIDADQPKIMVVPDAATHPVFMKNPAVVGGAVRSYVGAPLVTSQGQVLGTLCLIDKRPSRVTPQDMDRLTLAARHIAGLLEMRSAARRSQQLESQLAAVVEDSQRVAVRWMTVLDHLDVGIVLMKLDDRSIVYANNTVASVFGVTTDDVRGLTREQFLNGAARLARDEAEFRRALAVPPTGPFAGNAVLELARPKRRLLRWSSTPVQIDGTALQMATFTDVTAEVDLARSRERESRIDMLTGLANRRGFAIEMAREVARSRRSKAPLWVAMFDLDTFKQVNDVHGHAVGDAVLVSVAGVLRKSLRSIDVIARRGGEEFVALLGDCDATTAMLAAERVRAAVAALRMPSGPITISGGIALVEAYDVEAAIAVADGRLFEAKKSGRNRIVGPSTSSAAQLSPG